jgi:hypothetical protein
MSFVDTWTKLHKQFQSVENKVSSSIHVSEATIADTQLKLRESFACSKYYINTIPNELPCVMQVNVIEELVHELEKMKGIPCDVRTKAVDALWQGIGYQLDEFRKTLLDAKLADVELQQSLSVNTTLVDVCKRILTKEHVLDVSECDSLDYYENLLLGNPLLFDQFLQSSIKDNSVIDVMCLMQFRLSNICRQHAYHRYQMHPAPNLPTDSLQ